MSPDGTSPDIATVFCEDAREWDDYLADCFQQQLAPRAINILHEKLEDLQLPLAPATAKSISQAKAVLVIISPDFLDTVERRGPELFDLGRLLEPGRTVAMLCGVTQEEVGISHRAAFPSYSSWPFLVAKNQDKDFVLSVVSTTCSILKKAEEEQDEVRKGTKAHQFRLSPRKVQEGNTKVFIMLSQALLQTQKFEVMLESGSTKEVPAKWRNPYVLQFVVPDSFLQTSKMINVHVRCDGSLLGVRQLKCESKLSELHNLLQTAVSPYEMLCLTMGLATLHEADIALTKAFQLNIPNEGFCFLKPQQLLVERKRGEELLPTLLHFSAYYGLQELTSTLLQCPGALHCCLLLNCKGQSPAALATSAGHFDIASMLQDFQKVASAESPDKMAGHKVSTLRAAAKPKPAASKSPSSCIHYANEDMANYDTPSIPRAVPISNPSYGMTDTLRNIVSPSETQKDQEEDEYLTMMPLCPAPLMDAPKSASPSPSDVSANATSEEATQDASTMEFANTQEDLIKIIEMYKKGVPFSQVEQMFQVWKKNNKSAKDENGLQAIRDMYKQKQKGSAEGKGKQFFNFSDIRQILKGKSGRRSSGASTKAADSSVDSPDTFRRVSTLSAASTSSSGSNTSSSSSDRLSTMSSLSAYDSGTHSDSCEEAGKAPVPPPRPPRFPTQKQSHQYYKFPPATEEPNEDVTARKHNQGKTLQPNGKDKDYVVADMQLLMKSLKQTNQVSNGAGIYYDIPQLPRPVEQRHNPLLDYDFPAAALRRVAQLPKSSSGEHNYYDIPKFSYPSCSPREARLSIPDIPPPPVPEDD